MQIHLVIGPAGSGKTLGCLRQAGQALGSSAQGPALLLLAPKQTTYQLERQLLASTRIEGYSRLHILSFERLAYYLFSRLDRAVPAMLEEEGRLMVLRGLLARKRQDLKLFRASARLTGFAQQLSQVLGQLQRSQLTPQLMHELAQQVPESEGLRYKLDDLAMLLADYLQWLEARHLQDADSLLEAATALLRADSGSEAPTAPAAGVVNPPASRPALEAREQGASDAGLAVGYLWVDGFAEFSEQELGLLEALLPYCQGATLTLCLEQLPSKRSSWLSAWSVVNRTFERCRHRFLKMPGADVRVEILSRQPGQGRFEGNPVLQHLERYWNQPQPYGGRAEAARSPAPASSSNGQAGLSDAGGGIGGQRPAESAAEVHRHLRVVECAEPEAEAIVAAQESLRHVRQGGRYREITVLVRHLEDYQQALQRVFSRYQIPFFLDRRESVAHHPLAELTRSALRTVAFGWQRDDWFAALKSGLIGVEELELDRLENEALARGWHGAVWRKPLVLRGEPELSRWVAELQQRLLPPFEQLALGLGRCDNRPTGPQLAQALRQFWDAVGVEGRLQAWAEAEVSKGDLRLPNSVHGTVWEQMKGWLANIELGFSAEALALGEWLPILEAGLANLTVGVVPPALDQVLIGAIERSRNPDIKLALVLGLNETVFPAQPQGGSLLSESDCRQLEGCNVNLGLSARHQLGRERFYAYIACSRARQRLVLSCAQQTASGSPLNRSPFLSQLQQLFPALAVEEGSPRQDWRQSEHVNELLSRWLKQRSGPQEPAPLPELEGLLEQLNHFAVWQPSEGLTPELAQRLYGSVLRSSVSRLEQFAACPFKFFVHSGLRAEERQRFELDIKEQGTFQHDVMALFHEQLRAEGKAWRELSPGQARERVGQIAASLLSSYRDGLLQASEQTRFMARVMTESLQDFVETLVEWMGRQYQFEPARVELPFGEGPVPPWSLELGGGQRLELYGRIDRVDLCAGAKPGEALCVVVDYKSSQKQLDEVLIANGLQLQLLTYLNVLRQWPEPQRTFGVERLVPAGVFYVNLHGNYPREANRLEGLAHQAEARKLAYRHRGRFALPALPQLDSRAEARQGDQFNYRLTGAGQVYKSCQEGLGQEQFEALLDSVESNLKEMAQRIFRGAAEVAPYRKGASTACEQCGYRAVCRLEPGSGRYRILSKEQPGSAQAVV